MEHINTKKISLVDRKVLGRYPYRGIQKEVADELKMSPVAVHRAIEKGDFDVIKLILEKMVEVNRTIDTLHSIESELKLHFSRAANGALEIDLQQNENQGNMPKNANGEHFTQNGMQQ